MQVTNELVKESFDCKISKREITDRVDDLLDLETILKYCKSINERVYYEEDFLNIEIANGITIRDVLEFTQMDIFYGPKREQYLFLQEMISKNCKRKEQECDNENVIYCSCGKYQSSASNLQEYAFARQGYLEKIKKHEEYNDFMRTCFPNTIFSNDCEKELGKIQHFSKHVKEITKMLSVLDENAIEIYKKWQPDTSSAMAEIQALAGRECSNDPKHKETLIFEFECDDKGIKSIECQPHLKLIRRDSDLRIYFYWRDSKVGNGEKVLVGRIGRHTWKK